MPWFEYVITAPEGNQRAMGLIEAENAQDAEEQLKLRYPRGILVSLTLYAMPGE